MRTILPCFAFALVGFILAANADIAFAQLPTATILGIVRDSSGGVIPGADVAAKNIETGQSRTTISAEDGSYRFPALPVGNYEVRAELAGFQAVVRNGLSLTVGRDAVVNFTLAPGSVQETVSVTAEASLVNTTSGTLGSLVTEQKVADLPLNGRNYMDLTLMQPGIVQQTDKSGTGLASGGMWYSSNGASLRSNNYMLDGAIMTNAHAGTSASQDSSTLGVDGIREYRVVTNSFSAEYGLTSGSQVVIVSKGGTNQLHGSVFEYLRNSALDARNFFDYKSVASQRRLPEFQRNQFGASLGGPLKTDKTFVFGVFEGVRQHLGVTTIDHVIPASAKVDGGAGGVPQVAPVIKPLLALFPDPNLPGDQYTYPASQPLSDNYGQARVDHIFSTKDSLFVRYTVEDTQITDPLAYQPFRNVRSSRNQFMTLSETRIISPTLLNTARASFSRTAPAIDSPSGIIGPQVSFVAGKEFGSITIGGITGLGSAATSPSKQKQNIFTYSDDLFYSRGKHSVKMGTLVNHYQQYLLTQTNSRGAVSFVDLRSFLLGQPNTYNALTPGSIPDRTWHYNTIGFYGQDDVRIRTNLTLNLGLRYEFQTVPHDIHGVQSALRNVLSDAAATLGPPFENPSLLNFSPRLGFAWDVTGNGTTAIRGGFGELFDLGLYAQALAIATTGTPPFASNSIVNNPVTLTLPLLFPASAAGKSLRTQDYHMRQPHLLSYNLTVERQLPEKMVLTVADAGSRGLNVVTTTDGNPTVPLGMGVNGVCVPAPASAVADIHRANACWLGNDPRANPNWGTMEFKTAGSSSWYNSLQTGLVKQLSHGLQFQSSYTWSKLLDFGQGQATGDNNGSSLYISDPSNRGRDRAVADFDITHVWRLNGIYELPRLLAGTPLGGVLGGWKASALLSATSGLPFTPALNSNRSRSGVGGGGGGIDRPDVLPGRTVRNIIRGGPNQYFDPTAFTLPPPGFLGNAGRNMLRGPGLANLDFSMSKDTRLKGLGETGTLQFRAEFFNLLNRANFSPPNRIVFAGTGAAVPLPNVGQITSTATPARQIQFALRFLF
jgi:hypothetical protein